MCGVAITQRETPLTPCMYRIQTYKKTSHYTNLMYYFCNICYYIFEMRYKQTLSPTFVCVYLSYTRSKAQKKGALENSSTPFLMDL